MGAIMDLQLSKSIQNKLENASITLGFQQQEIIQRAIVYYLDSIKSKIEFKQELNNFDLLSDEALINFEKSL